jgi:hypothetical protein
MELPERCNELSVEVEIASRERRSVQSARKIRSSIEEDRRTNERFVWAVEATELIYTIAEAFCFAHEDHLFLMDYPAAEGQTWCDFLVVLHH